MEGALWIIVLDVGMNAKKLFKSIIKRLRLGTDDQYHNTT